MLIIKAGGTFEGLRAERGDYEHWFTRGCGLSEGQVQVLRACEGEPLPTDLSNFLGIIVTGAAAMVTEREPWSEDTGQLMVRASRAGLPMLGVCYGHQLLAHALGGEVGDNPAGRQVGSARVSLERAARADRLFGGLPDPLDVQVSHRQSVLRLPEDAELLGTTQADGNHVFRYGLNAWGVQFHPEFDDQIIPHYIHERRETILAEGLDPAAMLAAIKPSTHGERLLQRFTRICWEHDASA